MKYLRLFIFLPSIFLNTRASAQQPDSLLLDSAVRSGLLKAIAAEDKFYGGEKAVYLQPGIISNRLKALEGAQLGITIDLGHLPFNRSDWFNNYLAAMVNNIWKLHCFEIAYTDHPMIAYNVRAPLLSYRLLFHNHEGKAMYFGMYGFFGNQLHYKNGFYYYSIALSPSLQIRNWMFTFSYNPKPYPKKLNKTYNTYEEYLTDPERLDRAAIINEHTSVQLKLTYIIRL